MDLLNVGFNQYVNTNKVLSILPFGSNPVRRDVEEARQRGTLINANKGRKTLSVIYLEEGYIMTCGFRSEALNDRNNVQKGND
jgi:hypothetical protein